MKKDVQHLEEGPWGWDQVNKKGAFTGWLRLETVQPGGELERLSIAS